MTAASREFPTAARNALHDAALQRALSNVPTGFIAKRRKAREALPEFEQLRDDAKRIKDHTLQHLDLYLEAYEKQVLASGGHVHWARNAEEARLAVLHICKEAGARVVTKGKSMVSEEIDLNAYLENAGLDVVETDLGEYLIQLRGERPSHIIAPAIHLNRDQIEADFRSHHKGLGEARVLDEASALVEEARNVLREKFLSADVGITGANLLVAETGSSIIVTNEGNGDLTQTLPKIHVVLATIEKLIPTLEDANTILRLLARSATGQEMSTYTTFSTGPRRSDDPDGPEAYHVILLDNGRSQMLGSDFNDMLRCIRCGACMNHCPVYQSVGGHAYGWVYPGPMGSVLTPSLIGIDEAGHLPNASTFCGRCEAVCPVRIPLTQMMRQWRNREFDTASSSFFSRAALAFWVFLAKRPRLYALAASAGARLLALLGGARGNIRTLPFASGWTKVRDMPASQGQTFQALWRKEGGGRS